MYGVCVSYIGIVSSLTHVNGADDADPLPIVTIEHHVLEQQPRRSVHAYNIITGSRHTAHEAHVTANHQCVIIARKIFHFWYCVSGQLCKFTIGRSCSDQSEC